MGMLEWLGLRGSNARDAPAVTDSVRDSGQVFTFGRADSGERVDEKSAMQIATVYACVRLLAETVAGLPLHLYRYTDDSEKGKERAKKNIAVMLFLCHNRTNMGGHPGSIRPAECGPKADGCFSPRFADGTMLLRSGKRSIHKESFQ